jgi:hypothetical protein
LPSGAVGALEDRLDRLAGPPGLTAILAPLRTWLAELNTLIATANEEVARMAEHDAMATQLMTRPVSARWWR